MTVIDFGCGMGFTAIPMAKLVGGAGRIIAIDLQQKMLDELVRRATKAGVASRIEPLKCDADAMGECQQADLAVAFYSAHEVPDVQRLISEIYERLRDRGRFLVVEPRGHVGKKQFDEMASLAVDAGFVVDGVPRVRLSRAVLLL